MVAAVVRGRRSRPRRGGRRGGRRAGCQAVAVSCGAAARRGRRADADGASAGRPRVTAAVRRWPTRTDCTPGRPRGWCRRRGCSTRGSSCATSTPESGPVPASQPVARGHAGRAVRPRGRGEATGQPGAEALDHVVALAARALRRGGARPPPRRRAPGADGRPAPLAASPGIAIGPARSAARGRSSSPRRARRRTPTAEWRRLPRGHRRRSAARSSGSAASAAREVGESEAAIFDAHLLLLDDAELLDDVREPDRRGRRRAPGLGRCGRPRSRREFAAPATIPTCAPAPPTSRGRASRCCARCSAGAPARRASTATACWSPTTSPPPKSPSSTRRGSTGLVLLARQPDRPQRDPGPVARHPGSGRRRASRARRRRRHDGRARRRHRATSSSTRRRDAPAELASSRSTTLARRQRRARPRLPAGRHRATASRSSSAPTSDRVDDARPAAGERCRPRRTGPHRVPVPRPRRRTRRRRAGRGVPRRSPRRSADRRITLRTLDVGGDKPLALPPQPAEANPFLGVRGIRLALAQSEAAAPTSCERSSAWRTRPRSA